MKDANNNTDTISQDIGPTPSHPSDHTLQPSINLSSQHVQKKEPSTAHRAAVPPENSTVILSEESTRAEPVSTLQPRRLTQAILSAALRRIGLSGSGSKSVLTDRLSQAAVTDGSRILSPARMWEVHKSVDPEVQTNASRAGGERGRAPNWTKHETAPLLHVIADARHSTIVVRMYQRIETRSELDAGRHDPFAHELLELFNDETFNPDIPEPVCGATEDLLLQFNPTEHPHKRNGTILKQRWGKLRSSCRVACDKYNKSGQGDLNTFPNFTNGDDSLSYMHCVFYNHPSLDAVVRAIPPNAQIEAGLNEVDANRSAIPPAQTSGRKRRREDSIESVAAALSKMAETSSSPQPIVIQESASATATDPNILHLEKATKVASTVTQLMDLESKIMRSIGSLPRDTVTSSDSMRRLLENCLAQTRKIIESAMSSIDRSSENVNES